MAEQAQELKFDFDKDNINALSPDDIIKLATEHTTDSESVAQEQGNEFGRGFQFAKDDAGVIVQKETEEAEEKSDEEKPTEETEGEEKVVEKEEKEPEEKEPVKEETPAGVLTKDGKHVISYNVLADSRKQKQEFENLSKNLTESLATANAEILSLQATKEAEAPVEITIPENVRIAQEAAVNALEAMKGDDDSDMNHPVMKQIYEASQAAVEASLKEAAELRREIDNIRKAQEATAANTQSVVVDEFQDAIDHNSDISAWQIREDKLYWDRAVGLHNALLETDRDFVSMNYEDRLKMVADTVQKVYGQDKELEVKENKETTEEKEVVEDLKETTETRTADTETETKVPKSVSEIPGGLTPKEDKYGKALELSGAALQAYLGKQLDAELKKDRNVNMSRSLDEVIDSL